MQKLNSKTARKHSALLGREPFFPNSHSFPHTANLSFSVVFNKLWHTYLPVDDCAFTSAPWASSNLTILTCPPLAAAIKGVMSPLIPRSSTLACIARRTCEQKGDQQHWQVTTSMSRWLKCYTKPPPSPTHNFVLETLREVSTKNALATCSLCISPHLPVNWHFPLS